MKRKIVLCTLIAVLVALLLTTVYSALQRHRRIIAIGKIKTYGVDVFQDPGCTINLTSIDWGTLAPGESKNFTAYVKNPGNSPGILSMNTSSWDPAIAQEYLTLTWTAENVTLDPGEVFQVTFMLSVSPTVHGVDPFSFTINVWISG